MQTAYPVQPVGSRLRSGVVTSACAHVALLGLLSILPALFPPRVVIMGTGAGGGRGGDIVRVGLADLDGGSGNLFKPALTPEAPAVPAPAKPEDVQVPPQADDFPVAPAKRAQKEQPPAKTSPRKEVKATLPATTIPRETGPGAGGAGRSGGSGGGFGGGQGVRIGTGAGGEGLMDSWYARQVEKRIGENWLKTNFDSLAGRRLATIIRFDILPDGRISNVVMEQRSGVTFYDAAAERAIRSSNPLPRPPAEFQSSAIRFVSYFEYPPEAQ
jgi:TonB family protein